MKNMAEIGVYRGDFAEMLLKKCDSIEKYYYDRSLASFR
jgi:hypothetical protein